MYVVVNIEGRASSGDTSATAILASLHWRAEQRYQRHTPNTRPIARQVYILCYVFYSCDFSENFND